MNDAPLILASALKKHFSWCYTYSMLNAIQKDAGVLSRGSLDETRRKPGPRIGVMDPRDRPKPEEP